MYVPSSFRVEDEAEILSFMQRHDFVTLVTATKDGPTATHVPVLADREGEKIVIRGHLARANPHARELDGTTEALLIFHGPHGFVSPHWYENAPAVPTWNYGVVHAYGKPAICDSPERIRAHLAEMVLRYESQRPNPWYLAEVPDEFVAKLVGAIVAFEMKVERFEAKFKLGQNRPVADREGTIAGLEREGTASATELAEFMRRYAFGT